MKEISLNKFLENPEENVGPYYNFYDWFCSDSSLKRRFLSFIPKIRFLVKQGVLDGEALFFWLKNNCPIYGTTYDDIRFSTLEYDEKGNSKFRGGIAPRQGFNCDNSCNVWFFINNGQELKTHSFPTWNDFKKVIKGDPETREYFRKGFKGEL